MILFDPHYYYDYYRLEKIPHVKIEVRKPFVPKNSHKRTNKKRK